MSIKPPTKALPRDLSLREIDAAIARLEPSPPVPGPPDPPGRLVTVEYSVLVSFLKMVRGKVERGQFTEDEIGTVRRIAHNCNVDGWPDDKATLDHIADKMAGTRRAV